MSFFKRHLKLLLQSNPAYKALVRENRCGFRENKGF